MSDVGELHVLVIHAAIVLAIILAVSILDALGKVDQSTASGVFYAALGFAGAKAATTSGRKRVEDA